MTDSQVRRRTGPGSSRREMTGRETTTGRNMSAVQMTGRGGMILGDLTVHRMIVVEMTIPGMIIGGTTIRGNMVDGTTIRGSMVNEMTIRRKIADETTIRGMIVDKTTLRAAAIRGTDHDRQRGHISRTLSKPDCVSPWNKMPAASATAGEIGSVEIGTEVTPEDGGKGRRSLPEGRSDVGEGRSCVGNQIARNQSFPLVSFSSVLGLAL